MHQCCIKFFIMNKQKIYQQIKAGGGRLTKVRKELVRILLEEKCLISQTKILTKLYNKGTIPNRSTVYRELQFLMKNNILIKNTLAGIDYYEIPQDHHHHLVCLGCNLISKVKLDTHLGKQEKKLAKQNKLANITELVIFLFIDTNSYLIYYTRKINYKV